MTTRVLGAVRQSKTRDKAVSPATQRSKIRAWASANGGRVVKVTEDLSTSGSKSAFKRPELGPWLTDPERVAAWDILVTLRLDRACRDTADYLTLRKWAREHGKRVVFLNNPELDESTPAGKAMGTLQATFAEFERDMIVERNRERYATMVELGKWPGGRVPYGWRADRGVLVSDETEDLHKGTADTLRSMADMAIAGKSNGQIQRWLNANGHLNGNGKPWYVERVRLVLHADTTMRLLGAAKASELSAALKSREQTHGERVGGHMLLRVAFCRTCGGPLYALVEKSRPDNGRYRCVKCGFSRRKDELEGFSADCLLFLHGDDELTDYKLVPGDNHQAAIHALERDIDALGKISGTESVIDAKQAEIDHLKSLPYEPDRYVPVPLGITVAAHWDALDDEGKGSFLRKYHVRVFADKHNMEFRGGLLEESEDKPGYLVPLRAESLS